ncbi:large ribosomal subunit protein bL35m [Battus philenor]|uniref:large ribosomal subunit protein bL35m n=1 Tax=Battus philenor TaxID=42288 RepID=UPI0035CFE970
MLRCALSVLRTATIQVKHRNAAYTIYQNVRNYTAVNPNYKYITFAPNNTGSLINNRHILEICSNLTPVPVRGVTKFSLKRGKRKTVKAAVRRFFRLHWGGWIRPKVGRHKKLWKKSPPQRRRLRQHVFCNSTQSTLLDKMVTKFWKRPKHYVEDPYAPYHTREEFFITRKKPVPRN